MAWDNGGMGEKKFDRDKLVETIEELKNNPEACTTVAGTTGDIIIPESNPGEKLSEFISYLYENELLDLNYVDNFEKIKDKEIADYAYEEARTALTKIIRADRFVSGELYTCVKEGILAEVLEKILELQDAE